MMRGSATVREPSIMAERDTTGAGLRVIVAYKVAKAGGEIALAAILVGAEVPAGDVAATLSRHVTAAWSLEVSRVVSGAAAPHAIELMIAALVLDGALTLGEGWALHRRFPWAPWLVVLSTGSLLPFEVVELVRRPRAVRLLILVVNVGIVGYLASRATRERRARRGPEPVPRDSYRNDVGQRYGGDEDA
jgi:uncharacterized membrane protein (DUF2068 family)